MIKQFITNPLFVVMSMLFVWSTPLVHGQATQHSLLLKVFVQAELMPQQHVHASGSPQLVVLNNQICPQVNGLSWFDRPVLWLTGTEIQRQGRVSYIEFTSYTQLNPRRVAMSFVVHCAEACAQYIHVYEYELDAATNAWQIASNSSYYQR